MNGERTMSDPNKPQTELAGTPAKDDEPRESLASRLKPFILVFLLLFLPVALFHAFTDYMYVCRINLPAGTKVVDASVLPERSPLGQFICDSALIRNGIGTGLPRTWATGITSSRRARRKSAWERSTE